MRGLSLPVVRILLTLALIFAPPLLHATVACAGTGSGDLSVHDHSHASNGHAHVHGNAASSHHGDKSCCDTACNMGCTAIVDSVDAAGAPQSAPSLAAVLSLYPGRSPDPDLRPPEAFLESPVVA
jgi:hypothetical protein